jgi:hypothetical protein
LVVGLIAAPLVLGAVSVTALISAAPASAATELRPNGTGGWQGLVPTAAGEVFTGVMIKMNQGGIAFFGVNSDTMTLKLTNPKWNLNVGVRPRFCIKIDGKCFAGKAIVTSRDVIELPDLSTEVLAGFVGGREAIVNINDGDIVWTFDLDGFMAAMSDAFNYNKPSHQYLY